MRYLRDYMGLCLYKSHQLNAFISGPHRVEIPLFLHNRLWRLSYRFSHTLNVGVMTRRQVYCLLLTGGQWRATFSSQSYIGVNRKPLGLLIGAPFIIPSVSEKNRCGIRKFSPAVILQVHHKIWFTIATFCGNGRIRRQAESFFVDHKSATWCKIYFTYVIVSYFVSGRTEFG